MMPRQLSVARIGNSRGVRIPAATLVRYRIGDAVIMEERDDGILLRPIRTTDTQLSFAETAREMSMASEDWSDFTSALADGLEHVPWNSPRIRQVAETSPPYEVDGVKRPSAPSSTDSPPAAPRSKRRSR